MTTKEFKKLIDGVEIESATGECYIAIAKAGNEASVSFFRSEGCVGDNAVQADDQV